MAAVAVGARAWQLIVCAVHLIILVPVGRSITKGWGLDGQAGGAPHCWCAGYKQLPHRTRHTWHNSLTTPSPKAPAAAGAVQAAAAAAVMPALVPRPLALMLPAPAALAGRRLLAGRLDGDEGAVSEGILTPPLSPLLLQARWAGGKEAGSAGYA